MIIVCVDNEFRETQLTLDKHYDVISNYNNEWVVIIDDSGNKYQFAYWRFKKLEELREDKLNELGI
jgi:predicted double-glycine peptidase